MKFQSKIIESRSQDGRSYECFVCAAKSDTKGLSLIQCQTVFSRITLGEKLQEVLGSKYLVLLSAKDSICWDCATYLNWIDRFEHKIELIKELVFEHIHAKYKKIEVNLQEERDAPTEAPPPGSLVAAPVKHVHFQDTPEEIPARSGRRRKEYRCKYCGKEYVSLVSLTMHIQRTHAIGETCRDCGAKFESKAKLRKHTKLAHPIPGKELTCVSCGFHTTNTEVYCRHVCNSSIVSLTCISCHKRYVDSNFRDVTGAYKCQACQRLEKGEDESPRSGKDAFEVDSVGENASDERAVEEKQADELEEENQLPDEQPQSVQRDHEEGDEGDEDNMEILVSPSASQTHQPPEEEDMGASELGVEIPEFFKESAMTSDGRLQKKEEHESYLRCEGCSDEFRLRDLTQHPCFIRGDTVEFVEVEAPTSVQKGQPQQLLMCKACNFQFSNIESLRNHWDHTGHLREVNTPIVEINKIKDKFRKTETTFKVVKQNFSIRAVVPGQNEEVLRASDDYRDIFVRVSDIKTDPIEDFVRKNGNSCGTCGLTFSSTDLLSEHQKLECLTCVTCGINFYDNKLLKKHYLYTGHASKLRTTTSPPPLVNIMNNFGFKCHLCVKTFPSRFLLRKHFQVHYKGTDRGACQFCLMEFDNKNDIQQHVLEVHGAHLYKCSHCERTFMSEMFRNRHEAKHKNVKAPAECKICNIKVNNQKSLLLHNETYHRGTACRLCGKVVVDPISLKRHERRHYFDRELECNLCKKRFRSKSLLFAHSKMHTSDEMKYQCEVCFLGFLSDDTFKEHRLTHLKKRRYKCTRCNFTFSSRAHYWMHSKTHGISHPCTVCNRSFSDSSMLAIHRRKHWRVRPYQCPQCHRVFSVSSTLLRHLYVHSRQYPHRCGICKKGFLTRHAYHRHTETVHAVSNNFQPTRSNIPSLPLNATDEDILQAADTLIADDSIMFNEYANKEIEQSSSTDLITNEVVVETTELFDEILH